MWMGWGFIIFGLIWGNSISLCLSDSTMKGDARLQRSEGKERGDGPIKKGNAAAPWTIISREWKGGQSN